MELCHTCTDIILVMNNHYEALNWMLRRLYIEVLFIVWFKWYAKICARIEL